MSIARYEIYDNIGSMYELCSCYDNGVIMNELCSYISCMTFIMIPTTNFHQSFFSLLDYIFEMTKEEIFYFGNFTYFCFHLREIVLCLEPESFNFGNFVF